MGRIVGTLARCEQNGCAGFGKTGVSVDAHTGKTGTATPEQEVGTTSHYGIVLLWHNGVRVSLGRALTH